MPNNDRRSAAGIDLINRRLVGAALVHSDLLVYIVGLNGFVKKALSRCLVALGGKKKVERFAFLGYSAIKVSPDSFDLDVCFVHSPTDTNWPLVFTKDFFKDGQKPDRPAVDRRMVDEHASLLAIISSRWR